MEIGSVKGIAYLIIGLVSAVLIIGGNALTILAILRKKKLATASNQFTLGLALADLLVGIAVPYCTGTFFMHNGEPGNYSNFVVKCLLSVIPVVIGCFASFFHIYAIALDRFLSLAYPIQHKVQLTKGRARLIIVILWAISLVLASVPVYWNRHNYVEERPGKVDSCMIRTIPYKYYTHILLPTYTIFVLKFIFMYIWICFVASTKTSDVVKPLKVVGLVMGCFIFCWTPFVIALFFKLKTDSPIDINQTLYASTYVLVTINSFINPFIYAWKNMDFRNYFIQFLHCKRNLPEVSVTEPLGTEASVCL